MKIIRDPIQTFRQTIEVSPGGEISWTLPHPQTGIPLMLVEIEKIDAELSKEYSSYIEIQMDLQDSVLALERMSKFNAESEMDIRNAFFCEAVISYCRPFNKGYGRKVQLKDAEPWILDQGQEKKWHKEIVGIRNKIIAHSDRSHPLRQVQCYVAFDTLPKPEFVVLSQMKLQLVGFSNEDVARMKSHIVSVTERVQPHITELADKITKKFITLSITEPSHFRSADVISRE